MAYEDILYEVAGGRATITINRPEVRNAFRPETVTELIEHVGLSQPLVSWHLGKLRLAGLVETRRAGRETVSRLLPEAWDRFASYERRVLGLQHGDFCLLRAEAEVRGALRKPVPKTPGGLL